MGVKNKAGQNKQINLTWFSKTLMKFGDVLQCISTFWSNYKYIQLNKNAEWISKDIKNIVIKKHASPAISRCNCGPSCTSSTYRAR